MGFRSRALLTLLACTTTSSAAIPADSSELVQKAVSLRELHADSTQQRDPDPVTQVAAVAMEKMIKMAIGKKKCDPEPCPEKPKPTPPPKQTAEERKREPDVRNALRNNLLWVVRQIPDIEAKSRGSVVGYITQEVLAVRRTTSPQVRQLMDTILKIDITDTSLENLHEKYQAFNDAFQAAGYEKAARTLRFAQPATKLLKYFSVDTVSSMNLPLASEFMRDVTHVIPQMNAGTNRTVKILTELADMVEVNKDGKQQTATEVAQALQKKDLDALTTPIAEAVFAVRNTLTNIPLKQKFATYGQIFQEVNMNDLNRYFMPVGSFIKDIPDFIEPAMNKQWNLSHTMAALRRVAQMTDEFNFRLNLTNVFGAINGASPQASTAMANLKTAEQAALGMATTKVQEGLRKYTNNVHGSSDGQNAEFADFANATVAYIQHLLSDGSNYLEGLSKTVASRFKDVVANTSIALEKVSIAAEKGVKTAVDATKYFACHLKDADSAAPECNTILVKQRANDTPITPAPSLIQVQAEAMTARQKLDEQLGIELGAKFHWRRENA